MYSYYKYNTQTHDILTCIINVSTFLFENYDGNIETIRYIGYTMYHEYPLYLNIWIIAIYIAP